MVEIESEEGHDRYDGNVFDSDETNANDAVTDQNTIASVVTENHDSEDGHTFDSIVITGIGILKLTKARVIYVMISVTFWCKMGVFHILQMLVWSRMGLLSFTSLLISYLYMCRCGVGWIDLCAQVNLRMWFL